LLLLNALSFADVQESPPTVRHHRVEETSDTSAQVDQAEAAMQKGDLGGAESLLKQALAADPNDYRAWFDLGYVYSESHRVDEAIDAYGHSVAAKPDIFESNLNLGILYARQGNAAQAAKYLKAATRLKPTGNPQEGAARAWQSLGHVLENSDPQQALAAFAEAAKLTPDNADAHISSAIILENQDKFDAAAAEYQAAISSDPKSQDALAGLANVCTRQKKYAEAESALRKLLALDPQNQNARLQLGRVLAAEGKQDEAATELKSVSPDQRGDPHTALELGTLYVKAGKYSDAEPLFRSALVALPNDPEVHYALGSLLMEEKKYPEAQQELLAAVKLKPDLGQAYSNLAVVAMQNKDYQLAINALDVRAQFLPESPGTYFLRATSFDNLKAVPQAVANYQRFLAADEGKLPNQEWQARHRLIALDPGNADKYRGKKGNAR
jgi:tetratricopeptide (TPR) repeat protein